MPWGRGLDVNAQHLTLPRLFPVNRSAGHAGDIAIKKLSVGFITRGPWALFRDRSDLRARRQSDGATAATRDRSH